jgi:heme/copper-type cytochrome/quinol oxidase subunit 2
MAGNEFTKLAIRHPVGYAVANGLFVFVAVAVRYKEIFWAAVAGGVFGLVIWFLWREGGFARRREQDPGGPVNKRNIFLNVLIFAVVFAISVGVLYLTTR